MTPDILKLPRLYVEQDLAPAQDLSFQNGALHYLRSVLRRKPGDKLRVFNGRDGEFLAQIQSLDKKRGLARATNKIKDQVPRPHTTALVFAPLKKKRMDVVIEKSVELGVTALYPVITARTEVRNLNEPRLLAQITEAAEQCERLDLPALHPPRPLPALLRDWPEACPLYACIERGDIQPLTRAFTGGDAAFLIGPVGGFEDAEIAALAPFEFIRPVSLGPQILRSETAAITSLSLAMLNTFGGP